MPGSTKTARNGCWLRLFSDTQGQAVLPACRRAIVELTISVIVATPRHATRRLQAVPAVGNTGQLAVDLLVTLQRSRSDAVASSCAAVLQSANVLPLVGNDAYAVAPSGVRGEMCSTLELHAAWALQEGCYLLQQRGPVVTGRQAAFAQEFAAWAARAAVGQVLIVSSLSAADRQDGDIRGPQLCCAAAAEGPAAPLQEALETAGVPRWQCVAGAKPIEERKIAPWCAHGAALCAASV